MIKSYLGLVIIFAVQHQVSSLSADVNHRVKNVHRKDIMKRLQDIQKRSVITQDPIDNYDLVVTVKPTETMLVKSVSRRHHHHRRHTGKDAYITINPYKLVKDANILQKNFNLTGESNKTQIQKDKITTMTNYLNDNQRGGGEVIATTQIQENKEATSHNPVKNHQNVTSVVPFYRRVNYLNDRQRNKPQKWVHCLDLVSPRLKGYTDNWPPKIITNRDGDIKRLAELLNTDVSVYTVEEIVAVLQQINNIPIRLFQWDSFAITTIMNVIIEGNKHNFRTLKHGIQNLFEKWHLDTTMMRTVLEQSRIFRPPCIDISGYSGHTKKVGGALLYTKPDKSTKKHRGADDSCHSREHSYFNNYD